MTAVSFRWSLLGSSGYPYVSVDGSIVLRINVFYSDAVGRHVECLELVVFTILTILCTLFIIYLFLCY